MIFHPDAGSTAAWGEPHNVINKEVAKILCRAGKLPRDWLADPDDPKMLHNLSIILMIMIAQECRQLRISTINQSL